MEGNEENDEKMSFKISNARQQREVRTITEYAAN